MSRTPANTSGADEMDLARLLGLLLDNKWWIMGITAVFAVGGIVYSLLATPIYHADALVQVENNRGASNPLADVRAALGEEPKVDAELGILRSRLVLGRAVDQERLDIVVQPHRLPLVGDFLARQGVKRPSFATSSVWAGEYLNIGDLQVEPHLLGTPFVLRARGGNVYTLHLDDRELGEGRVGEDAVFLEGNVILRVAELEAAPGAQFTVLQRSRLAAIGQLRSAFSVNQQGRDSGLFNLTLSDSDPQRAQRTLDTISQIYLLQNIQRQSAEAEQSLRFLEAQAPELRGQLTEAEDSLNAYRIQQSSVDLTQETQSLLSRMVNLESQLNELEFAEAEISRRFTPSHPTYATLLDKRQQLQNELADLNDQANDLPATQQQVLRLNRDVEVNQQIYVQLLNRIQEMNIAKASTVGSVRILDEAVTHPGAVEPNKKLIVAVSTMLGALLALGGTLLRVALRHGVESPDQIEEVGLPVYASVPLSEEQPRLAKRKHKRSGRSVDVGVLAERAPADTAIEALRGLRTSLHFAMLEASDNRLVITGPSPGVGKSFITINLGAVCAGGGQRVLVVDADMRKGHIHDAFGGASENGFSDLLIGRGGLAEAVRPTEIEGLHYISRGTAPPNPSELLLSERFGRFLDEASAQYDLVIIDTPPVLAVTDASVVSKKCGTTLMVARFQLNSAKELLAAQRRMETAGVEVKGCILNAIERKASRYSYGYYHYAYSASS